MTHTDCGHGATSRLSLDPSAREPQSDDGRTPPPPCAGPLKRDFGGVIHFDLVELREKRDVGVFNMINAFYSWVLGGKRNARRAQTPVISRGPTTSFHFRSCPTTPPNWGGAGPHWPLARVH